MVFLYYSRKFREIYLKSGYDRFLPRPFQFVMHCSSYHSALCPRAPLLFGIHGRRHYISADAAVPAAKFPASSMCTNDVSWLVTLDRSTLCTPRLPCRSSAVTGHTGFVTSGPRSHDARKESGLWRVNKNSVVLEVVRAKEVYIPMKTFKCTPQGRRSMRRPKMQWND